MLQDDLHARVSARFGLGRGVVGSEARHEAIDRAKGLEACARQAEREAAQAVEGMWKAHTEHKGLLARVGAAFEKGAELDRRTARAMVWASEAEAARAEARARQTGAGTYAEWVAACFAAVQALLVEAGVWSKLMGWAPFRAWAEKARGGMVADMDWEGEAAREREPVAARMASVAEMAR